MDSTVEYEGGFQAGLPHGEGVCIFANGARYEGQWEHGQRHGRGTFWEADGASYEGQWERDHCSGRGRLTVQSPVHHAAGSEAAGLRDDPLLSQLLNPVPHEQPRSTLLALGGGEGQSLDLVLAQAAAVTESMAEASMAESTAASWRHDRERYEQIQEAVSLVQRCVRRHRWQTLIRRVRTKLRPVHGPLRVVLYPIYDASLTSPTSWRGSLLGYEGPSGKQYREIALGLEPDHPLRMRCIFLVETSIFRAATLVVILANCVLMAAQAWAWAWTWAWA